MYDKVEKKTTRYDNDSELEVYEDDIEILNKKLDSLKTRQSLIILEYNNLLSWKKGRCFGLLFMLIICAILFVIVYPYTKVYYGSLGAEVMGGTEVLNMSISLTSLTFGYILFVSAAIFTFGLGIKTLAEVGSSRLARTIARSLGIKNYYICNDRITSSKELLDKEIFEIELKIKKIKNNIL